MKKLFILLFFSFLLNACGGSGENNTTQTQQTTSDSATTTNTQSNTSTTNQKISIQNHEGKEAISLDISPKEVIIKYDEGRKTITGEAKNSEKTKYYNEKGDILAEVKYKEEGFKLKSTDEKLLWKVKFKENKIKISDNEEGENPFEIKHYPDNGKFKAKSADKQWSEAKFKDGVITIQGTQIYKITAKENAGAYTILGLNLIPEEHRLILMAELLKMILYYAMGGGLGHITRSIALIQQLSLPTDKIILLTASPYTSFPFVPHQIKVCQIPSRLEDDLTLYQHWLQRVLAEHPIQAIYLDCFPCGILGEWTFFEHLQCPFYHIARLFKWEDYQKNHIQSNPTFEKTYLLEDIESPHLAFLKKHSKTIEKIAIQYPKVELLAPQRAFWEKLKSQYAQIWLIVHSEPLEEVEILLAYAQEVAHIAHQQPCFVVMTQIKLTTKHPNTYLWDAYPVEPFFEWADKIISACGFNVMQQTKPFREKHLFLPFERKFDDQFLRAKKERKIEI
jgi:uncharacterized protein YcfL